MSKPSYAELLKDQRWLDFRESILSRDGGRCVKCDRSDMGLEVHHCYYVSGRNPWEYPTDSLYTLCRSCHDHFSMLYTIINYDWEQSACGAIAGIRKAYQEKNFWAKHEYIPN